jgi:hypothetical protein
LVAADGGIFSFGDAGFYGSGVSADLSVPVVGVASTPSGRGYRLVTANGELLAFGDATDLGSPAGATGGTAPTPTANGFWIADGAGTVRTAGTATSLGSAPALNQPIVGLAAVS